MLALRTILAATDLTDACDDVLRAAAGLARRTGGALHMLHSFDFPPAPYFDDAAEAVTFQSRVEDSERTMEEQIGRTVPPDVAIAGRRVEIFTAARAITDYAAAIRADVIVMGPHTHHRRDAGFLGTTADRVIRTADVPVLVVRGELRLPLRRLLVPIDLSEPTNGVLDTALRWGAGLGAGDGTLPAPEVVEMEIVHVMPRILASAELPFARATVPPGMNAEVEAAVERAGRTSAVRVTEEVLWGDRPDREIVCFVRETGSELVVMATHGHGMVKRALIGSTASGVARAAPCPVLLLPPAVWRTADEHVVDAVHAAAG
ncbi:MAG TPA: universal stress protein [Longimicrobium sp.]|nr:universal stress protein [Longimicrobium sp.]